MRPIAVKAEPWNRICLAENSVDRGCRFDLVRGVEYAAESRAEGNDVVEIVLGGLPAGLAPISVTA
jgi:hypothetical protein